MQISDPKEMYDIVGNSPYSYTDLSKHIAMYLGEDWDKAFKDKVYQIISPKGKMIADEQIMKAFEWWTTVAENPFEVAVKAKGLQDASKNFSYIADVLEGRRSANRRTTKSMVSLLRKLASAN